jgi:hypothetical protein
LGSHSLRAVEPDQWGRKTIVTFSDSVEIPGHVLPTGTYLFRLADSSTDRHIVQIWNADETQILATAMAIPNTRFERPDKSIFEFEERASSSPMARKMRLYPHGTGVHLFPIFVFQLPVGTVGARDESGNL